MTAIVGIAEKGSVYIGGDSAGVAGLSISTRTDVKVFKNGPFVLGFTSSFRMGQILQYKFDPPKQTVGQDDMKYLVTILWFNLSNLSSTSPILDISILSMILKIFLPRVT